MVQLGGNRFKLSNLTSVVLFSLHCHTWSWGGHHSESLAVGRARPSPRRQLWAPPGLPSSLCSQLQWTFCPPHPPAKQTWPSWQTQAVTSLSLPHIWYLKDPTSPAQGRHLLNPWSNLPAIRTQQRALDERPLPSKGRLAVSQQNGDPFHPRLSGSAKLFSRTEPSVTGVPGSSPENSCPLSSLLYSLVLIHWKIGSYAKGVGDGI